MKKAAFSSSPVIRQTVIAGLLACGFGAFTSAPMAQVATPNVVNPDEIRYVKGRVLVQPRAGLSLQQLDKKLKAHGGRRTRTLPGINVHIVELPSRANEHAVAKTLRSDSHIRFAELDQLVPHALTPNDANFTSGWHLPKIGSPSAWDYSDGAGVTIAILDSGVDPTHPDLVGQLVPGYNAFDNNNDTRDVYGHGTKVAGAAAMVGNNLVGGTGVAFKSRIMPVRVTGLDGYASLSAMANGVVWAADRGARVANLSFQRSCGSSTLINAAQYMRSKGGVVTISAGNSGIQESMTASDAITCVGATDGSDNKASFSTYGSFVDVAAPGVGIYTTTRGGGYGSVSGTSFSAPITAGVYALMIAANASLSPSALDEALFSTALDLGQAGTDTYFGAGRVDAASAVAKVRSGLITDATPPSASIVSPAGTEPVSGLVAVDVNATDNVGIARVELLADGRLVASESKAPYVFSWDTSGFSGTVTLEAKAFDMAGNQGSARIPVTVEAGGGTGDDTTPPVVSLTPADGTVANGSTISISAQATDDTAVAQIILAVNGVKVAQVTGDTASYSLNLKTGKGKGRVTSGSTYTITATAFDKAGNNASAASIITTR